MAKKKIQIKRGALSGAEKKLIQDWLEFKNDEQIAADLGRTLKQVQEYKQIYLAGAPAVTAKRSEAEEFKRELRGKSEWVELESQLSARELIYFENQYILWKQQLKEMTFTEWMQVKQAIILDVFMNRHNTERMQSQREVERLDRLLEKEYKNPMVDPGVIEGLESTLQANKAAGNQRTKEYKDLVEKHQAILRDLKSTREQRIKNVDQKGKFIEVLKMLAQEDLRAIVNEEVGLHYAASQSEKKRLQQNHVYMDGVIDKPLLTPEDIS